jgi:threonine dehydratase
MLRRSPIDTLVIAVGGGGLISGIATAARALKPGLQIVGVQTSRFPAMFNAIKGATHPQGASTIAEGIAVGQPGRSRAASSASASTTSCSSTKATSSRPS